MQKLTEKSQSGGRVEFFGDYDQNFFLAHPQGNINPSLLKEDVTQARKFAKTLNAPWTYITNTEDVLFVNPFNLVYLKDVKKIRHLKRIVIFAPHLIHRIMIHLVSKIVQPDLIITNRSEYEKLLRNIH